MKPGQLREAGTMFYRESQERKSIFYGIPAFTTPKNLREAQSPPYRLGPGAIQAKDEAESIVALSHIEIGMEDGLFEFNPVW
ncbi:uncharacterized protein N7469_005998 [Penicillium citrinum]|uniref:Uncharacterized protein n=1 Tax=Penicillium citrinum TaxID=5077 RepID=A0A9W9NXG0_PENCI|nr:uncharacterized protein N7469_005998 [Penicillium citrinum]KAJ5231410.1 hypothetical protein N7469_005998 [Penicillium citrinum]